MSRRVIALTGVGVVALIVGLATPAIAQENIGASTVPLVTPASITAGATLDVCITANIISPDAEYLDRLDVNLPDGWVVNSVATNSVPVAQGCGGALPPVVGIEAGNVVYWQSTGYPPVTGCGAWNGGSGGTNFVFCANVTVPSCGGAPWSLPWNIIGDGWGGTPHSATGTYASITCEGGGGPSIELTKTVGTVAGVCATTDVITVATGTTVYYCYQVENTGDVTFNFHDLEDDQLGVILNDLPYVLAPGAFSPEIIVSDVVSGPVVNTGTWTAADVVGGYLVDDTIAYNWEDISTSGTQIPLNDDEVSGAIPLGFAFDYFGTSYSEVYVSSNGSLTVLPGQNSGCCSGDPIPTAGDPDGVIAGWWDDFYPPGGGPVTYQTLGAAPNRYLIVQFTNVPHCCSPGNLPVTMQFKLYEGTNVIEVHYQAALATGDGSDHSAGIENQDGTVGVQYYYGNADLPTPLAVRYTPSEVMEATDSDTATVVNTSDPDITVNPTSMFASQLTNTITQQTLNIGNTGEADLDWSIFEEGVELGVVQVTLAAGDAQAPEGTAVSAGPYTARPATSYAVQRGLPLFVPPNVLLLHSDSATTIQGLLLAYGDLATVDSFDAQAATPTLGQLQAYDVVLTWSNFVYGDPVGIGNVLADYVDAGGKVINLMFSMGTHGWQMAGRFMDQGYTAMNGTDLSFANICLGTFNPAHPIMAGVSNVCEYYRMTGTYLTTGSSEVAQWADGLLFVAVKDDQTVVSINGYVGDNYLWTGQMPDVLHNAILWIAGAQTMCTSPSDVPWLSEVPTNGMTAPGGSTPVDVFFDSTGIAVGIYDAVLCVNSNDPDEPIVQVPVQMEVVIPVELMGISVE